MPVDFSPSEGEGMLVLLFFKTPTLVAVAANLINLIITGGGGLLTSAANRPALNTFSTTLLIWGTEGMSPFALAAVRMGFMHSGGEVGLIIRARKTKEADSITSLDLLLDVHLLLEGSDLRGQIFDDLILVQDFGLQFFNS